MALIDVIKFEGDRDLIVWKYPSIDISYATQLVVNESQEVVFFKEGRALDVFGPGTHTLKTGNVPILEKLVNLPFGGKTPFTAEVYYVNKAVVPMKWGTRAPIPLEDPKYKIMIELRAFGSYNMKIVDSKNFVTTIVGASHKYSNGEIDEFLKPFIEQRLGDFLSEVVLNNNTSIVEINKYRNEAGSAGKTTVQADFSKYGIEIVDFLVQSINFDKDDPNFQKIQKVLSEKFEIDTLGAAYQQKRMLDIGEAAAKNESGGAGNTMGAGLGLGVGMNMGNMMAGMMGQQMNQPQGAPGQAPAANDPMTRIAKLKQLLDGGMISAEEFETKKKEILSSI
ncbi:MAG: SPFH domain-containing protein [Leptospiraceae bacterium]|nr:SPFH domain-containing protein [Leptospiraceae bacterium]